MAAQDFHQMVYSIAASNAADRSVVAADGDCAAVASVTAITPMMVTVVVAVPVMVGPHSHAANGGINGHLGGSGTTGVAMATTPTANKPRKIVRMGRPLWKL